MRIPDKVKRPLSAVFSERETGFEPATPTLARLYSTPEPLAHIMMRCSHQQDVSYNEMKQLSRKKKHFFQKHCLLFPE